MDIASSSNPSTNDESPSIPKCRRRRSISSSCNNFNDIPTAQLSITSHDHADMPWCFCHQSEFQRLDCSHASISEPIRSKDSLRISWSLAPIFSWKSRLPVLFIFLLISAPISAQLQQDPSVELVFHPTYENNDVHLEKMVYDSHTSRLYIGGVNHLYDVVTHDMHVREHAVTGPRDDSIECSGPPVPCTHPLYATNSHTKAMTIDYDSNKLIECTNLYQGRCRTRNLSNIGREAEVKESIRGIVANDATSSAVVFSGNGPPPSSGAVSSISPTGSGEQALYVGTTFTPNGGLREEVPAVSALSLDPNRLFNLSREQTFTGSYLKIHSLYRQTYRIDYVKGFQSNNFAYFATRQPKFTGEYNPTISKLVRVCINDPDFYSYTEVPLKCSKSDGTDYNLLQDIYLGKAGYDLAESLGINVEDEVLFGVFSKGEGGPEKNITSKNSALCIYPMKKVEQKFFENVRECFKGNTAKNLPWFGSNGKCTSTNYPDSEILCGKDVNNYIGGEIPISVEPIFVDRSLMTSVVTTTYMGATIAFIGTSNGILHKVLIENVEDATRIYRSIQLTDGSPILQDMALDDKNGYLYVLSKHNVYKVNIRHCAEASDCHSCLERADPYCGWCMTSSTCSIDNSCSRRIPEPATDWLNYKSGKCPFIKSLEPQQQQISISKVLSIKMDNGPSNSTSLSCHFIFPNSYEVKQPAVVRNDEIVCTAPSHRSLSNLGSTNGGKSVIAKLSIIQNQTGSSLASTNFTFFDCQKFRTCTECASSEFQCDWCMLSNKCVTNPDDVCKGETLVNGKERIGHATRKGPAYCPRFTADQGDIFVSSGRSRKISVKGHNLLQDPMSHFKCQFKISHMIHEKNAFLRSDRIECDDMKFEFFDQGEGNGTAIADFSVAWFKSGEKIGHLLDNTDNLRVVIYKCENLAPNCGLCLGLNYSMYECGWCNEISQCSYRDNCPNGWMNKKSGRPLCSFPKIIDFYPKKGPINGGTKVTITGVNLGLSYADVKDAVMVANSRCDVMEHEYELASRIVCHTRKPLTGTGQPVNVVVKLKDNLNFTAISDQTFTFVNPSVTSFTPHRGPISGGTDITIIGHNLDSGSQFSVRIGSIPCTVRERTEKKVVCRTQAADMSSSKTEPVILSVDGTMLKVDSVYFQYMPDPIVTRVSKPMSIMSGGIAIDVHGTGFNLLQRPHLVVTHEDEVLYGPKCEVVGESLMVCRTPTITMPPSRRSDVTAERPLRVDYGFDFDGALTGNLSQTRGFEQLNIFTDPKILKFSSIQTASPGSDLVLKGENLNVAASARDVNVTVGGTPCNVTALANVTLTCQLSPELPLDEELEVVVLIGQKLENVGIVSDRIGMDPSNYLFFAFAIAFIGIFLAIMLFVLYRRKSTSHNRQMRYLKNQMNSIEMKVAQECKEAFHELQTNMNAIAGSLPQGASFIPFLQYKDYTARILFPHSFSNHPVLHELTVDEDRAAAVESGLRQFHRLLFNKTFILAFVRTIDENKYFLLKDRVYVGSLLMVILQERMDYATDILKHLLKELIKRNLDCRYNPKILFRRAESVAERMLSIWFSFLMYPFLTRGSGQQLYQLYWATKQQTEKGPQDSITMDARYSLSEEKLLRSTFEFRELTVFVASDNSSVCDTQVRVLDCDSITQVKEKCIDAKYRTMPYSSRPHATDVDLELRIGTTKMVLADLDNTSKQENGVYRYNTLAHYKVENKATLALIPRQSSSSYNISMLSETTNKSSFSFLHNNSPTLSRQPFGTTGSKHSDPCSTLKVYHLVKQAADHGMSQDNQEKMVTEIYLTRLLTMKGTLQKFIEDLLEVIFSTSNRVTALPACIKYMFDFLDEQALEHGITDPDVVHTWKSNALPLRFWVNLIKNPDFIFDIQKPTKIEGSLNVVAQTLMDACSTQDHQLTKDSPSSKLLFANEIEKYKSCVHRYYRDIRTMPAIPEKEMNAHLIEESRAHSREFMIFSALNELYVYVNQNKEMIFEELSQNEFALQQQLPEKFQNMLQTMEVPPDTLVTNNGSLDGYNSKSRLMSNSNSRFY